jgi:hypothetical protein
VFTTDPRREEFQAILEGCAGNSNVYFQPPASIQMQYPCIVYQRYRGVTTFADNAPFHHTTRYQVTVIDPDPDSPIPLRVAALPMSTMDRFFIVDDLNHDVYNIYY